MRISIIIISVLAFLVPKNSNAQKESDAVVGIWLTSDRDAKVQIYKCDDDRYCGKLIWLEEPNEENGEPKKDDENPNPELRDRLIKGLEILKYFEYDEDYEWEDGEIYDPKSGSTYSCQMELLSGGKVLEVRGYIGISLFGRTETWTRVD